MNCELEHPSESFDDITIGNISEADVYTLLRAYIVRNMSPASLSRFDELVHGSLTVSLEEAVAAAVFNDAVVQAIEDEVSRIRAPIPPFNI